MYRVAGVNKYYNKHILNSNSSNNKRYASDINPHRQSAVAVNASQLNDAVSN